MLDLDAQAATAYQSYFNDNVKTALKQARQLRNQVGKAGRSGQRPAQQAGRHGTRCPGTDLTFERSENAFMPGGTASTPTFLFTDIEGSTRLLQSLGTRYAPLLDRQRELIAAAVEGAGGRVFGTEGDAVFASFPTAAAGVIAAARRPARA